MKWIICWYIYKISLSRSKLVDNIFCFFEIHSRTGLDAPLLWYVDNVFEAEYPCRLINQNYGYGTTKTRYDNVRSSRVFARYHQSSLFAGRYDKLLETNCKNWITQVVSELCYIWIISEGHNSENPSEIVSILYFLFEKLIHLSCAR